MGGRCGSDPVWLWRRPAAAAPIQPLAQELPYAAGMDIRKKKERKKSNYFMVLAKAYYYSKIIKSVKKKLPDAPN